MPGRGNRAASSSARTRYNLGVPAPLPLRTVLPVVAAAVFAALWPATPVIAQGSELEPILLILRQGGAATDASASSLQIYRVPIGVTLLDPQGRAWGLRLTFPVSFGFYDLQATSSVSDLVSRVQTVSVAPGVEFLVPVSRQWLLKPYAEVGLGMTTSGEFTGAQYTGGLRARGDYVRGPYHIAAGLGVHYASPRVSRVNIDDYTTLELAGNVQRELGFRVAGGDARAGVYAIARWFPGLRVEDAYDRLFDVKHVWELGVSFSTAPELALWKLPLPWIAVGYRFGDMFNGIRISFDFPF
jgi:hypothetical protein